MSRASEAWMVRLKHSAGGGPRFQIWETAKVGLIIAICMAVFIPTWKIALPSRSPPDCTTFKVDHNEARQRVAEWFDHRGGAQSGILQWLNENGVPESNVRATIAGSASSFNVTDSEPLFDDRKHYPNEVIVFIPFKAGHRTASLYFFVGGCASPEARAGIVS